MNSPKIPEYIIVQAGGKGTRLEHLTRNKPKALVSINGKPMIFHLFDQFPNAHFLVIADYKYEVFEKYLKAFAKVDYKLVDGRGHSKTCAGLPEALTFVPDNTPFMYLWSDLVLPENFRMPAADKNYIGLSHGFPCRWRYDNGKIEKIPSSETGVAGLFIFKNKGEIANVIIGGHKGIRLAF